MKKIYSLLFIVLGALSIVKAQNETAPNFIVTDIHGETHELYDYLCQGKYVVVDFFGTWCGPCQDVAPQVGQGFIDFGCNYNDVVFISIDTGSDTQACFDFEEEYMPGVYGLPMVSGTDGGGDAAHDAYGITGVPTIVTISPVDTTYQETHTGFYGVLAAAGIQQEAVCIPPLEVEVNSTSASSMNGFDGQASVQIEGGLEPISVSWTDADGNLISSTTELGEVASGTYEVTVLESSDDQEVFTTSVVVGYIGQDFTADDFESYTPFNEIVPQSTDWVTMCGEENVAQISQAYAQSGSNSMFVYNGPSDVYKSFGGLEWGSYEFSFNMLIPSNGGAYYRLMHKMVCEEEEEDEEICRKDEASIPAMEFYAENDGSAYINAGEEQVVNFTVPVEEWFEVKHLIDLNNGVAILSLNGDEVHTWPFIYQDRLIEGGLMSLDGVQFKSMTQEEQVRMFYVDDVNMEYAAEQDEVAGCTDDDALNFNIDATIDDGTCEENSACVPVALPFFEDFEEEEFLTNCWKNMDRDTDGYIWSHTENDELDAPEFGLKSTGSASYINNIGALDPDNLLRLPKLLIEENTTLSYYVKAEDSQYLDNYAVLVYVAHEDSMIDAGEHVIFTETVPGVDYVQRTLDLSDFAGEEVYIAFRHYNDENNYWMYIDNIYVYAMPLSVGENEVQETMGLYPNPAGASCYVTFAVKQRQEVMIEFVNIQGQRVMSRVVNATGSEIQNFNLSTLSAGVYLVRISTENERAYKRLVIR